MKDEIRSYLASLLTSGGLDGVEDSESLLEAEVIDSMSMVGLIAHLEKTYAIKIDEDDMTPENFDSIDAIAEYVAGKRSSD